MIEYNTNTNRFQPNPTVKTVVVTETEYDSEGRVVKETITETTYEEPRYPSYPYGATWNH